MIRVSVICEGKTEQRIVRNVLQPAFGARIGFEPIPVGGDIRAERLVRLVANQLKSQRDGFVTTMVDFQGTRGFPSSRGTDPAADALARESWLADQVATAMGASFRRERFRAYFSLHEVEALLFSDPAVLAAALDASSSARIERALRDIRDSSPTPEHINNSPQTKPSARIEALIPSYSKGEDGPPIAARIGLPAMRRECPHFDGWVRWLESLAEPR